MSLTWTYPVTRRDESVVEELHGYKVADPYRWLENPDSEETKAFVEAQNALTNKYLESYPFREKLRNTLTKIYDYEKYGCPFKYGNNYYYFYNTGLQPQSVLYQLKNSLNSPHGTASLNTYAFSKYGKYFAYGISKSGSDWVTMYVKTTENDQLLLDDVIEWIKFSSVDWMHDEAGFLYSRFPEPGKTDDKGTETDVNLDCTPQSDDILIYKDPSNPEYSYEASVSTDGRFVILTIGKDCDPVNKLWIFDLKKTDYRIVENLDFFKIVDNFDAEYIYLANDDMIFYFKTNLKAPRYKIVKYDLARPDEGFIEIVCEHPTDVLSFACVIAETNLVLTYMHDVKEKISIHALSTGKHIKDLPVPIGSIDTVRGRKEDTECFFKVATYLNPGVIYRYDFIKEELKEYWSTKITGLNSDLLETKQVFIESKDKTKIPAFITLPKNITLDGNNPTLLYGYGGFSISLTPTFSPFWLTFVQHYNGILVVPNLRGGGEYGEEWHKAGMLHNKQNVFDDCQYVAKWLIDNKYTRPEKLVVNGGSNGGLLVGACINQ
ncbi:10080_t:CDS:10, partial [Scutellospora calospora]